MMSLDAINAMPIDAFIAAFGDVAEHSPWVARNAASSQPFASRGAMIDAFAAATRDATQEAQLALIRAHPDLATKAMLTEDSANEQSVAGLNTLTAEEFNRFTRLNELYKSKFGFPFIFAVKGADKHQIMASFTERVNNSAEYEFTMAINQICRIFRFRIEDRVSP